MSNEQYTIIPVSALTAEVALAGGCTSINTARISLDGTLCVLAWPAGAPMPAAISSAYPQAAALSYKSDATTIDKTKQTKYAAGQVCGNCALFQGAAAATAGGCPLFAGKQVSSKGWCTAYAKKA